MWPQVRRVSKHKIPGSGSNLIILNWLRPNPFRMRSLPLLANIAIVGDVLFGGDLLGGRDRALTFSWHLVSDKTPPPHPQFLLFPRIFQEWRSSPRPLHPDACLTYSKALCFSLPSHPTFDSKCICPTLSRADYMNWWQGKGQRGGSLAKSAGGSCWGNPTSHRRRGSDSLQRGWRWVQWPWGR